MKTRSGVAGMRLANGREVSALEIQQEYLSKAIEFTDRRGADANHRAGCSNCGAARCARWKAAT